LALFTSIIRENRTEEFIEIRSRTDDRLMTLIEIPSPTNKSLPHGRTAYLDTRRVARSQGASIVEIDLCLTGTPMLDYSRDGLPEWDYVITITRSNQPEKYEVYTTTLAKRLPRFKIPLAADDRDTVIDLQSAFMRTYDQGNFQQHINYRQSPDVRFKPAKADWINQLLNDAKFRD
jgi:hypothetical protein